MDLGLIVILCIICQKQVQWCYDQVSFVEDASVRAMEVGATWYSIAQMALSNLSWILWWFPKGVTSYPCWAKRNLLLGALRYLRNGTVHTSMLWSQWPVSRNISREIDPSLSHVLQGIPNTVVLFIYTVNAIKVALSMISGHFPEWTTICDSAPFGVSFEVQPRHFFLLL